MFLVSTETFEGLCVTLAGTGMRIIGLGSEGFLETTHLPGTLIVTTASRPPFRASLHSLHPLFPQILSKADPFLTEIPSR